MGRARRRLAAASSMEAFWKRKRRCRLQNANGRAANAETRACGRELPAGGKLPGGRELVQRNDAQPAVVGLLRVAVWGPYERRDLEAMMRIAHPYLPPRPPGRAGRA